MVFIYSGKIITIETIGVPVLDGQMDSSRITWTESMNEDTLYAYSLRVFHLKDVSNKTHEIQQSQIGIDFSMMYNIIVCPVICIFYLTN